MNSDCSFSPTDSPSPNSQFSYDPFSGNNHFLSSQYNTPTRQYAPLQPYSETRELPNPTSRHRTEPNFRDLYDRFTRTNDQLIKVVQENQELRRELDEMRKLHSAPSTPITPNPSSNPALTWAPVLIPSQPATRPSNYPPEILWTFEDSKKSPDVPSTVGNTSRPNMSYVIRRSDGTLVTEADYNAILSTSRDLMQDLLALPEPRDSRAKNMTRGKTFFKTYHPFQWRKVVGVLEEQHLLVALCSEHWKAEHIIGASLANWNSRNSPSGERKRKAKESIQPETSKGSSPIQQPNAKKSRKTNPSGVHPDAQPTPPQTSLTMNTELQGINRPEGEMAVQGVEMDAEAHPNRKQPISLAFPFASTSPTDSANSIPDATTGTTLAMANINPSYTSIMNVLSDILPPSNEHHLKAARLLASIQANPTFRSGPTAPRTLTLLSCIENADPDAPGVEERCTSWGHDQFRSGGLMDSGSDLLEKWDEIGDTKAVYRLLASCLTICRVARHIGFQQQRQESSYLSDMYLERVIERLWKAWSDAGGSGVDEKGTETQRGGNASTARAAPSPSLPTTTRLDSETELTPTTPTMLIPMADSMGKELESLHKEELKRWAEEHRLDLTTIPKRHTKKDLIAAILKAPALPPINVAKESISAILANFQMSPCSLSGTQAIEQSKFWDGDGLNWDTHWIGWAMAGGCVIVTIVISTISILQHSRNYTDPREQCQILRILYMPPVYAIVAFFSYPTFQGYPYYSFISMAYGAIGLYAFVKLIDEYTAHVTTEVQWTFSQWQYVFVLVAAFIGQIICENSKPGELCDFKGFNPKSCLLYIKCALFISTSVALCGLLRFYHLMKKKLATKRLLAKCLCIELIVMFTFYQSFVFIALEGQVIHETQSWTAGENANSLNALAVCVEMVIFSALMMWAYSANIYNNAQPRPTSIGQPLLDS
ncbi:hypothetical protein BDN72DRAFT_957420 [Pluteus cervinus]|uniref:Uncharacterized protein n=1 Tax=Pluteus cervinus TaxID=181527 RepID=A0ACD3B2I8_9AGAR|nr:hypothetical protein BDN72DRAFT_957420 [Pluteus cervinus]